MSKTTVVSAPGKVLVAGGYLVLDRAYTGLVFGLDARIHVAVTHSTGSPIITVTSPQFQDAVWRYDYATGQSGVRVDQIGLAQNPFVETTIRYVLSYLPAISLQSINITILADNDYYTTPAGSKRFHDFGIPLSKAHKTGLGSSAALVTALTAALLQHLDAGFSKQKLHNLAQAAHCAAQGKVGSGFDVASAVYGSCIYRRFSPSILSLPDNEDFVSKLRQTVDREWDMEISDKVTIPDGLRMVMCDVDCGSQTPGMVKQVLAWRASNPEEADAIWESLQAANLELAADLKNPKAFDAVRQQIRLMGEKSGVAIEPPAQTSLIDACGNIRGVVGGTVPGAGGYDAIVLLIEDKNEVMTELMSFLSDWQSGDGGKVSILGVREDTHGVKVEQVSKYTDWLN